MPRLFGRLYPVAFGLAALLAVTSAFAGEASPTTSAPKSSAPLDVSADLAAVIAKHHVPGMVVLAMKGDGIIAQGAAGVRQTGTGVPVTFADKFHLGSDTKAMTATLVALLVDEDKLHWTTTLGELFGDLVPDMHPDWKGVTVQQVLAHRAGFPANPAPDLQAKLRLSSTDTTEQRRQLISVVLTQPPVQAPGSAKLYSNIGYMIAGSMVEKITGQSWEKVMRERLFEPLGITSGGFGGPGSTTTLDQPRGHLATGQPVPASADNPAFYGPAGGVHMAIADWAKFVALHLRGDPANPYPQVRLLKAETFAAIHSLPAQGDYNSGWKVANVPAFKGAALDATGRTLSHDGTNTYWFCRALLAPEANIAFLLACNRGGPDAQKACEEATSMLLKSLVRRATSPKAPPASPTAPAGEKTPSQP